MHMNVIGAGDGRTSNHSLKLAINQLGLGPCHHMQEVLYDMPQTEALVPQFSRQRA